MKFVDGLLSFGNFSSFLIKRFLTLLKLVRFQINAKWRKFPISLNDSEFKNCGSRGEIWDKVEKLGSSYVDKGLVVCTSLYDEKTKVKIVDYK